MSLCTENSLKINHTLFSLKFWLLWNATKSNRAYYYENDQKTKLISQKYRWFCDNTSLTENNPKLQNLPYDYFEHDTFIRQSSLSNFCFRN
jgi:hypothetical protein